MRIVVFRGRKLRLRRYRRYEFTVGRRIYKMFNVRRRLLIEFRNQWVPLRIIGGKRRVHYGRRWYTLTRTGRYWRIRVGGRSYPLLHLRLRVTFKGRRRKIVRHKNKWLLHYKRKWRSLRSIIRRYVRYEGRRHWLKRRQGMWSLRAGGVWRRISRPKGGKFFTVIVLCFDVRCFGWLLQG